MDVNGRTGRESGTNLAARRLIGIDELSALWGIPKATLYNWVSQRRIPHVKLGRCLRFDLAQIERVRDRATIDPASGR